jgi:hypothetical protein
VLEGLHNRLTMASTRSKTPTLALLAAIGCAVDGSRDGVRLACADAVEAWTPLQSAWDVAEGFDTRCTRALGEAIDLYWDGEELDLHPRDLLDDPTATYLLAGVFVLAADQEGTVAAVLDDPFLPPFALEPLHQSRVDHGLAGDDPADALWFAFVQDSIDMAMVVDTGPAGLYDHDTALITSDPDEWDVLPAFASKTLIHEASHRHAMPHVACDWDPTSRTCDATPDAAYGAAIWWTNRWIRRHPEIYAHPACSELESFQGGSCVVAIIDLPDDWEPCWKVCTDT